MINQEEYEVLKELGDKWKWIARDGFKSKLNVYNVRPTRSNFINWWLTNGWSGISKTISPYFFPFIQWTDSEPYFIPDLIKEYEDRGDIRYASSVENIIVPKQEITYEDAIKVIAENIDTDEFSVGLYIEALNNNEKYEFPTEKWIEDNTSPVDDEGRLYVWKRDLQNLIVPKQELPVIPKYVADYIEECKRFDESGRKTLYIAMDSMPKEVSEWMRFDVEGFGKGQELFARAYLDGYTVEKEQKYYAKIKGHELVNDSEDGYWNVDGNELYIDNIWHDNSGYKTTKLTKCDWNSLGINEDNADLVKVEEVE